MILSVMLLLLDRLLPSSKPDSPSSSSFINSSPLSFTGELNAGADDLGYKVGVVSCSVEVGVSDSSRVLRQYIDSAESRPCNFCDIWAAGRPNSLASSCTLCQNRWWSNQWKSGAVISKREVQFATEFWIASLVNGGGATSKWIRRNKLDLECDY